MKRAEFIKQRNQLISEIVILCITVTENTEHDVFFNYSGNVDAIWLHYNKDGWKAETCAETRKNISPICDHIDSRNEENYEIIIKNLHDYRNSLQELLPC